MQKDHSTAPVPSEGATALPACMVYVAADPMQPGAAWAICVDKPQWAKETAKSVAGWIKQGANVQHVDIETGKAMLMKWVRPGKQREIEA